MQWQMQSAQWAAMMQAFSRGFGGRKGVGVSRCEEEHAGNPEAKHDEACDAPRLI